MGKSYRIAVVPGDGIGPEAASAACLVAAAAVGSAAVLQFETHAAGAQCYQERGSALPSETLAACLAADAVLHGAAGLPDILFPDGTEAGQDFSMKKSQY